MQKKLFVLILIIALTTLTACERATTLAVPTSPSESPSPQVHPSAELVPVGTHESQPPKEDNQQRAQVFRSFLQENYQTITETCYCPIMGLGFLDLDQDGSIEMLIFDTGASASAGLQFFDIVDGRVECVSANMRALGETFKGQNSTDIYVNANLFDDFRLMTDSSTGALFFVVDSWNGTANSSYHDQIRFDSNNGVLTLSSLFYRDSERNEEDGSIISESFRVAGREASRAEYDSAVAAFSASAKDTDFLARGVFLYEKDLYQNGLEGVLAMCDDAIALSVLPQ